MLKLVRLLLKTTRDKWKLHTKSRLHEKSVKAVQKEQGLIEDKEE